MVGLDTILYDSNNDLVGEISVAGTIPGTLLDTSSTTTLEIWVEACSLFTSVEAECLSHQHHDHEGYTEEEFYNAYFGPLDSAEGDRHCLSRGVMYELQFTPAILGDIDCEYEVVWGDCTGACGPDGGQQDASYSIITPAAGNGAACPTGTPPGSPRACDTGVVCPVDCEWSVSWSGNCDGDCGTGVEEGTIMVTTQSEGAGAPCPADDTETRTCDTGVPCPVDCVFHIDWEDCQTDAIEDCGTGSRTGTYVVDAPPEHGGQACPVGTVTGECQSVGCCVEGETIPSVKYLPGADGQGVYISTRPQEGVEPQYRIQNVNYWVLDTVDDPEAPTPHPRNFEGCDFPQCYNHLRDADEPARPEPYLPPRTGCIMSQYCYAGFLASSGDIDALTSGLTRNVDDALQACLDEPTCGGVTVNTAPPESLDGVSAAVWFKVPDHPFTAHPSWTSWKKLCFSGEPQQ